MSFTFLGKVVRGYFIVVLFLIFIGTLTGNDLVWEINDLSNGCMVIPNALALFSLTNLVKNFCTDLKG